MASASNESMNPRYKVLFEPVQIGPVLAPNRFYQVPHCNGMGHLRPSDCIAMREIKAQGGWGVVCTEECEIDPSSEFSPCVEARLWDERDARILARMAQAVHRHGALAGIELAYNGPAVANRMSRMIPLAPSSMPVDPFDPVQARAMDKADIRDFRGWHPEQVPAVKTSRRVLVAGAGPAGLECGLTLARRGMDVQIAEARTEPGGRSLLESKLPGLATWARIHEHRLHLLGKLDNVEIFPQSKLSFADIVDLQANMVVVATGSHWRRDGIGRRIRSPLALPAGLPVFTPDDLLIGKRPPPGPVMIFDDDHYYLAGVLAVLLRNENYPVVLTTPAPQVCAWTEFTLEQERIQRQLADLGVQMWVQHDIVAGYGTQIELQSRVSGQIQQLEAASVLLVTARESDDELYWQLKDNLQVLAAQGTDNICRIGDCEAPGTLAAAVYSGHRLAREFDQAKNHGEAMRREFPCVVEESING